MNEKILRFALISDRLALEARSQNSVRSQEVNFPEVLTKYHLQNAAALGLDYQWHNPRFATITQVLSQTVEHELARDVMLILDEASQLISNEAIANRHAKLKDNTHVEYGKYFYPAFFLRDVYLGSEALRGQLSSDLSYEYFLKLARVWTDYLDQDITGLIDSPNVLVFYNGQPNIQTNRILIETARLESEAINKSLELQKAL